MAGRLLLDENLSPRLARDLAASFPDSAHVRDVAIKSGHLPQTTVSRSSPRTMTFAA
jgi:predicted nuclease of predicted toxin-antitoxin system